MIYKFFNICYFCRERKEIHIRRKVEENEEKAKQNRKRIAHTQNSYLWSHLGIYVNFIYMNICIDTVKYFVLQNKIYYKDK